MRADACALSLVTLLASCDLVHVCQQPGVRIIFLPAAGTFCVLWSSVLADGAGDDVEKLLTVVRVAGYSVPLLLAAIMAPLGLTICACVLNRTCQNE